MKVLLTLCGLFLTVCLFGQEAKSTPYSIGEKRLIFSQVLGEEREILIYVPKGFWGMDEPMTHLPVAIVLDGESQFFQTVAAFDFLSAAPLGNDWIPQTIVVGIPNTNRNRDLTPKKGMIRKDTASMAITGGGAAFLDFITTELLPYIDDQFSTSEHRTIIGHSLGGLMVFAALLEKREFFTNYLAIDPAVNYDQESYFHEILDTLRTADLSRENLFVAQANSFPTFLTAADIQEDSSEVVDITRTNQKLRQRSAKASWKIRSAIRDFPTENHFSIPYPGTYEGLRFLYEYYPFKEMINYYHPSFKDRSDLVAKLRQHYQAISDQLGYPVKPMESYLYSWAYGLSHFDRHDLALDLFDYSIQLYPNRSSVYNAKAYFLLNQGKEKAAIEWFKRSLTIQEDEEIRAVLERLKSD